MGLVATIAGRSLRQRPGRTLFSILGIAVGIATVVGVFTLDHNTVVGLSLRGAQDWKPALEVRPSRGLADPEKSLVGTPGVAAASAFFQNDVEAQPVPRVDREPRDAERARLFALDAASLEELDAVRVSRGRTLAADPERREALVGEALADKLGLEPGDEVVLARPARAPRQACVDGEVRTLEDDLSERDVPPRASFTVVGLLAREHLGRRSQGAVVVVDYRHGRELFAGTHVEPVLWVRQDPAVDIERLRASLGTSFSYDLNKHVVVGAAADERAFRNGVRMAGLLALVLGLYVIFHTLSMSLVERVREVATLDALGTSRGQVARIFLAEALFVAIVAAALGLGGGLALARALLLLGVTTLGTGHHIQVFEVPWGAVLALTSLGVGIALLGSVYPLLRARGASTVAALRGEEALESTGVARGFRLFAALLLVGLLPALYFTIVPVVGEAQGALVGAILAAVGLLALLVVLPLLVPALLARISATLTSPMERLWPLSGRLAARTIATSPARIAVAAAAIALVASAFVGLKGMTASLRGEIVAWADRALAGKVYVQGLPHVALGDLRAQVERMSGGSTRLLGIEPGGARSYVPFLLLGLEPAELTRYGPYAEDPAVRAALDAGTGVIVSRRLARNLGYAVGDKVHVSTAAGTVEDLTVAAVSDAYGYFPHPDERIYGVASAGFLRRAYCVDASAVERAAVVLAPGGDPEVVRAAATALAPDARIQVETGSGLLAEHLADLERDFRLFDVILGLTALLAALGVLNGQLLAALERAKELGVLKALGASRRQIAGMVLAEATVVGLSGGIVGTALGAALTPVIVRALEGLSGLELPVASAGTWLAIVPVGALLLAWLASLYPILRIQRMDAVAAVRTG